MATKRFVLLSMAADLVLVIVADADLPAPRADQAINVILWVSLAGW